MKILKKLSLLVALSATGFFAINSMNKPLEEEFVDLGGNGKNKLAGWQVSYPLHNIILNFNERAARSASKEISHITLEDLVVNTLHDLNETYKQSFFAKDNYYFQTPLELAKNFQKKYRNDVWKQLSYVQRSKLAGGLLNYNDEVTKAWDRIIKHLEFLQKLPSKQVIIEEKKK